MMDMQATKRLLNTAAHRHTGAKTHMQRRSITIDDENDEAMMQLRGHLLISNKIDLDVTRTVNMLLALGIHRLAKGTKELTDEEYAIVTKYLFTSEVLEYEAVTDEEWNKWIKYSLPKIVKKAEEQEQASTEKS